MSLKGIILKTGYYLYNHRIGPVPVGYAPLILAAAISIAVATSLLSWPWAVVSIIVALTLFIVIRFTGRQGYIIFRAKRFSSPQVRLLQTDEKVAGHATGHFEVNGKRRYFVEAQTYYSTVETREHILMACIPKSRFLLIATSPRDEVGWWYAFFRPEMLRAIKTGEVIFGMRPRPAMQVTYQPDDSSVQIIHLSFDDTNSLYRVLNDLRLDENLP